MFDISNMAGPDCDDTPSRRKKGEARNVFGEYELLRELGKGTYGVVSDAVRKSDGVHFAIKHIDKKAAGAKGLSEVFSEVEILSLLDHPSIVRLEDIFEDSNSLWLVMELVRGGELEKELKRHGTGFDEQVTRRITRCILTALEYIHGKGIVHRDLKLANMLVSGHLEEGGYCDVKVADFGFSCVVSNESTLTSFCGTTVFMAPEILTDRPYGKPVDMWALGAITYVLAYAALPFTAGNESELVEKICEAEYQFKDNLVETPPSSGCKDFIKKLLVIDPLLRMTATEALHHYWVRGGSNDVYFDDGSSYSEDDVGAESTTTDTTLRKSRKKHPKSRWKKAFNIIKAAHRFLYFTRCEALRESECDVPILKSFSYLTTGRFEPVGGVVNVSGITTSRAILRICDMVESSTTTETWDLSNCSITYEGLQSVIKVATSHPKLATLDLSNNQISSAGARAVLRLARTGRLKFLHLKGTGVSQEIISQVEASLRDTRSTIGGRRPSRRKGPGTNNPPSSSSSSSSCTPLPLISSALPKLTPLSGTGGRKFGSAKTPRAKTTRP
eukprot:TRINITY_DN3961_c0_g1_i1.p1 TRINITY_DN3961_c0_g1~~TRINITY_DN3961_c0_g1_i1.p1  ORF type:complete len:558 (+),score=89.73 TRINITY_DN3961_c0_g1_i1:183-1856(+)